MKIRYIPTDDVRNLEINNEILKNFADTLNENNPDLIIVVGGDGSLLHAIQKHNKYQVPFFGIAGGTLNFLMNPSSGPINLFKRIKEDKVKFSEIETTSVKVSHYNKGVKKLLGYAVNDVVIGSTIMGYHQFVINSFDKSFSNFSINGSGICISTDLGSTGYNFNLGGPVLPLASKMWSIKGIVCNRYLEDIVELQNIVISCNSTRSSAEIYIDGISQQFELGINDKVILDKGQKIKIAFLDKKDFISRRLEIASRYRK